MPPSAKLCSSLSLTPGVQIVMIPFPDHTIAKGSLESPDNTTNASTIEMYRACGGEPARLANSVDDARSNRCTTVLIWVASTTSPYWTNCHWSSLGGPE